MVKSDVERFRFVGGELCFDFINTIGGRESLSQIRAEKLREYVDLIDWARDRSLFSESESRRLERKAQRNPRRASQLLRRSIAFREAIYRIFISLMGKRSASSEDLRKLNEELRAARQKELLASTSEGFELKWDGEVESFEFILGAVARSAVHFLVSGNWNRVKECPALDCHWLFVDTSRNGSREWCSMQDCGNRDKVRRFRKKHNK